MSELKFLSSWGAHIPDGFEFNAAGLAQDRSLPESWMRILEREPERELFCDLGGPWISRGEFVTRTERCANAIWARGLRRGDRVIMSAPASIGLIVHYVAALRLGLVVVPMNTAYTRSEVSHVVKDVKPSGAIVDSAERAEWISDAVSIPGFFSAFAGPGADLPPPKSDLAVFFAQDEYREEDIKEVVLDQLELDAPAIIAYTSGTTGRPKGAILTHGNLLASAKSLNLAWRWREEDRLVLALPLFHMHGLGVGVNGTLCSGSSAVLLDKFEPATVLKAVTDYSASMFFGVPTMYQRFLDESSLEGLGSLRLMVSGSAPLSKEVHRRIEERTGMAVLERYGTTESLINISNPYDFERIAGKVGFPLPGVEVILSGENSELFISGPTVFKGYLNDAGATSDVFPGGDRWFATGDIAQVDERGYISIVGRLKDLIITGGYNVYPKEVEEALRSHAAVLDAAVVGMESETWGEEVVAFVIKRSDVSERELIRHSSESLANFKRPKKILFVNEFPRNALGKVVSSELRRIGTPTQGS